MEDKGAELLKESHELLCRAVELLELTVNMNFKNAVVVMRFKNAVADYEIAVQELLNETKLGTVEA